MFKVINPHIMVSRLTMVRTTFISSFKDLYVSYLYLTSVAHTHDGVNLISRFFIYYIINEECVSSFGPSLSSKWFKGQ